MNITKIRLLGLETVDLPVVVAHPSNPFILKGADGLGPTGSDLFISGRVFQGRQPISRQMVFRVGLNPNYSLDQTVSDLRGRLYQMLNPNTEDGTVPVFFYNNETIVARELTGRVGKVEPVLFSPETEAQITMDCVNSYFESPNLVTVVPTAKDSFNLFNEGDAPAGVEFEVVFTTNKSSWTVTHGTKQMTFTHAFVAGDILRFNTQAGSRDIVRVRGGVQTPIIESLTGPSTWFELRNGVNTFTTSDQTFNWGHIRYRPRYQGV